MSWKIPLKYGWWLGVPRHDSGNLHILWVLSQSGRRGYRMIHGNKKWRSTLNIANKSMQHIATRAKHSPRIDPSPDHKNTPAYVRLVKSTLKKPQIKPVTVEYTRIHITHRNCMYIMYVYIYISYKHINEFMSSPSLALRSTALMYFFRYSLDLQDYKSASDEATTRWISSPSGYMMLYDDIWWYVVIYYDNLWYMMLYDDDNDIWRYLMIYVMHVHAFNHHLPSQSIKHQASTSSNKRLQQPNSTPLTVASDKFQGWEQVQQLTGAVTSQSIQRIFASKGRCRAVDEGQLPERQLWNSQLCF